MKIIHSVILAASCCTVCIQGMDKETKTNYDHARQVIADEFAPFNAAMGLFSGFLGSFIPAMGNNVETKLQEELCNSNLPCNEKIQKLFTLKAISLCEKRTTICTIENVNALRKAFALLVAQHNNDPFFDPLSVASTQLNTHYNPKKSAKRLKGINQNLAYIEDQEKGLRETLFPQSDEQPEHLSQDQQLFNIFTEAVDKLALDAPSNS